MHQIVTQQSSGRLPKSESAIWGILLLIWFIALCAIPDPRPLAAPEWLVGIFRSMAGLMEPSARLFATIALRATGLGVLGVLVPLSLSSMRMRWMGPLVILVASVLAVASQWINYGYFPIIMQLELGIASAVLGALAGLALRRNWIAAGAFVILAVGIFVWGTSTGISNELDVAARAIGKQLLQDADRIPSGDTGFQSILEAAFTIASDNSPAGDAVFANKAAILALGVILGEERVAEVAKRQIDLSNLDAFKSLRDRITLRGRNDLVRHFWVSAALAVLSTEAQSTTVGIAKEMMDTAPGGSGFSFIDLTADFAGTQFAKVATQSRESSLDLQKRIALGMNSTDFCPDIGGLPEGLKGDQFQKEYGGLGGAETRRLVQEIQSRLSTCTGLNYSQ